MEDECDDFEANLPFLRTTNPLGQSQEIQVGTSPVDILLFDSNGDGLPDFAVANQDSNDVSIILGNPDVSFGEATNFRVGFGPAVIGTGDFNSDENSDVVTANQGSFPDEGGVSLLIGNGDGTFQPAVEVSPGNSNAVAVADLNGDGDDDLVQALFDLSAVTVLLGNGDGTFEAARNFDTPALAWSLAVGDFDSDDNLDIAAGIQSGLAVLLGDGSGDFQVSQEFVFPPGATFQTDVGDFDLDGHLDIVTTNNDNSVSVLLNLGDGTFADPHFYAVNDLPNALSVLDLNDDNFLDLFVSNFNADHSSILFNNGDGTFRAGSGLAAPEFFDFSNGASSLTAADLDQDGFPDLAVSTGRNTVLFRGAPGARFQSGEELAKRSIFLTSGDFNQDSETDLALVRRQDETGTTRPGIFILEGRGDGTFDDGQDIRFPGFDFQAGPVASGLIDGGDSLDLLVLDRVANEMKFLSGNGDGTFQAPISIPVGSNPVQLALGDLDGDGSLDVAIANQGLLGQGNGNVSVLLGNGDGSFEDPVEVLGNATLFQVALGDVNGDANLDLVTNTDFQFNSNVSVLLGNGDGTFQPAVNLPEPHEFSFNNAPIQIVDFDSDGDGDVLVAGQDHELTIFPSNGDGTFGEPVGGDIGPDARDMVVADLDLDRKPDVALASDSLVVTMLNLSGAENASAELVAGSGGVASIKTSGPGGPLTAGYATITPDFGIAPYGTAAFSLIQNGVVVSEAGVPSFPPTLNALIPIDKRVGVAPVGAGTLSFDTGFAVVNMGAKVANVTYILRNRSGQNLAQGAGTLQPGEHISKFIERLADISDFVLPPNFASDIQFGTLEFESNQPLSVTGLRLTTNQRGESLITTIPVVDLSQEVTSDSIALPHLVNGGGTNTTVLLINTTDQTQEGVIDVFADDGSPLPLTGVPLGGSSTINYSIPPKGLFIFQSDGSPENTQQGWAKVTPNAGHTTPVGAGIFQISQNNILVTESGVPSARLTTKARLFLDTNEGHNTGVAIANPNGGSIDVMYRAFEEDGSTPAGNESTRPLVANGHEGRFAGVLVPGLPPNFTGVMELMSDQPFAALTLRTLTNQRGEFLITTFPIADSNSPAPLPIVFPQVADGGGISTQVIAISPQGAAAATVNYFGDDGKPAAIAGGQ